jgi:glycosyltransferase involved in cell wall biosynthesis
MSQKSFSVSFVLPSRGTHPVGGFKVVYEYANELARRGHRVAIVHPALIGNEQFSAFQYGKIAIRYFLRHIDKSYTPNAWFPIDPRVKLLWVPTLHPRYIPDSDVIVATWWRTAEWVASYPASKGRKFYLVQHLETWGGPEDRVLATWRLPLQKIVIARWLEAIANDMGEPAVYIPNGLNFNAFAIDVDPGERDAHRVMMLYHDEPWKGSTGGLAALDIARKQVPDLEAHLFGVHPAPAGFSGWIHYHQNPPQAGLRQLYNQASVFLAPSWAEGWPLPPAEAMMSGCAVAATNIGGHQEYCIAGQTALLSPSKNPEALAENLILLLQNPDRRIGLARAANEFIQQFTWERAGDAFETAIGANDVDKQ